MGDTLPRGHDTVMAGATRLGHLGMIVITRSEGCSGMTILTLITRLSHNVERILAWGNNAIVATGTGADGFIMISLVDWFPCVSAVACITGIAGIDMSWCLALGLIVIVTCETRQVEQAVVDRYLFPVTGIVAVFAGLDDTQV